MTDFADSLRALNSAAHAAVRAHDRGHDTEITVRGHGPTRTREILTNIAHTTDMLVDRLHPKD